MTSDMKSCIVALPTQCNHATFAKKDATPCATPMQPKGRIGLKALADAAFVRNLECNQCATTEKKPCNFSPKNDPEKLHSPAVEKVAQLHELHATFLKDATLSDDHTESDTTTAPDESNQDGDWITRVKVEPGQCPLCGGDLSREGLDGCWHRTGEDPFPEPAIDGLYPCSLCGGEFFYQGNRGGYFCKKCQSLPEGSEPVQVVRGITPRGKDYLRGDDPGYMPEAPPYDDKPMAAPTACRSRISPVAVAWLAGNRVQLRAAGWMPSELYRRNKSRGIAWVGLWAMPGLTIAVETGGAISFNFQDIAGKTIRQTAWPRKSQHRSPKNDR